MSGQWRLGVDLALRFSSHPFLTAG